MKKILLFVAGLMLAAGASAQVYLRGNGDWDSLDRQFTDNGNGTYTLEQAITLQSDFKIASEDWKTINFGSAGEEAKIGTISVTAGSNDNIKVSSAINATKIILDTNASTLTIEGAEGGAITYSSWTICGVGELVGDAWDPASANNVMTESNGVFTLTKYSVELSTSFVTDAGLESETPGYGYKVAADGKWGVKEFPASGNQFLSPDADGVYNVVFTWNPATEELTATLAAATEEPEQPEEPTAIDEVDAEDAVVAAYDLLGRPVAADAAGYVILQYASGKAAKVFNN